ncbi:hypothetical protein PFLUV_G00018090 [Perca fluviatilis]|uniref:Uncharacterized protein n=1 Tax=Perca fluviatilis TaxID=8168 RepID=A0A6A5FNA5_PERFL|nr:hypothetical protein PFLUV_G00018090 [Perca fluviatilis]
MRASSSCPRSPSLVFATSTTTTWESAKPSRCSGANEVQLWTGKLGRTGTLGREQSRPGLIVKVQGVLCKFLYINISFLTITVIHKGVINVSQFRLGLLSSCSTSGNHFPFYVGAQLPFVFNVDFIYPTSACCPVNSNVPTISNYKRCQISWHVVVIFNGDIHVFNKTAVTSIKSYRIVPFDM